MAFIQTQKLGKVCARCGESDTSKLEFHHVDSATKRYAVSHMGCCSRIAVLAEIAKCILLCKLCHGKHHRQEQVNSAVSPLCSKWHNPLEAN